jgi:hypothetical protein
MQGCLAFDRIIWRGSGFREPHRMEGWMRMGSTLSADLGFRCAR